MKTVRITFIGHIRMLAGEDTMEAFVEEGKTSIADILRTAERRYENLRLLEDNIPIQGILVFRRNRGGGLDRIDDYAGPAPTSGEYVVATGMEGG